MPSIRRMSTYSCPSISPKSWIGTTCGSCNRPAVRASAGSVFRLPISKITVREAISELRSRRIRAVATSSHKGVPLREADLSGRLAIVIGNEGSGLDKKLLAQMDALISIPHSPKVESLNAGIAASIVLYEVMSRERSA